MVLIDIVVLRCTKDVKFVVEVVVVDAIVLRVGNLHTSSVVCYVVVEYTVVAGAFSKMDATYVIHYLISRYSVRTASPNINTS
jgi:hypothetical protein